MWPAQYVPVRDAIVESYNPSIPADVTAHGLAIPAPILMSDNIHYNTTGHAIVASLVQIWLTQLGF